MLDHPQPQRAGAAIGIGENVRLPRRPTPPDPSMPTATAPLTARYAEELDAIRSQGLFKSERIITSPRSAEITLEDGRTVLNFCANNYLGLADHPAMIEAARAALDTHGFAMDSVRLDRKSTRLNS